MYSSVLLEEKAPRGDGFRAFLLFLAVAGMLLSNLMANLLPLNDVTTGEIAARYPTLITPAEYTFAIWGVIFVGMLALAIYQVLPAQWRSNTLRAIRGPLLINAIANGLWIYAWHNEQIAFSLLLMAIIAVTLAVTYGELNQYPVASRAEAWFVRAPISLYFGWVTVATFVNIAVAATAARWDGSPLRPEAWAIILLAVATLAACRIVYQRGDTLFALAAIWGLFAIGVQQIAVPLVVWSAYTAAGIVLVAMLAGRRHHATIYAQQPSLQSGAA
jgi:translocator protein